MDQNDPGATPQWWTVTTDSEGRYDVAEIAYGARAWRSREEADAFAIEARSRREAGAAALVAGRHRERARAA